MRGDSSEISRLEQANSLGVAFFRTMILLNGGAILAMLTYLGNSPAEAIFSIPLSAIRLALCAFLVGIVSMLMALLVSYSYTASAPETKYSKFWNNWIVCLNSICSVVSISAFVFGVIALISGAN